MKDIIDERQIKPKHKFSRFEFYDEEFFDLLRSRVEGLEGVDVENDRLTI